MAASLGRAAVAARPARREDVSAGIVCFEVDGLDAAAVVSQLGASGVRASVTPHAVTYPRLGTSLHMDEDDVTSRSKLSRGSLDPPGRGLLMPNSGIGSAGCAPPLVIGLLVQRARAPSSHRDPATVRCDERCG